MGAAVSSRAERGGSPVVVEGVVEGVLELFDAVVAPLVFPVEDDPLGLIALQGLHSVLALAQSCSNIAATASLLNTEALASRC